MSFRYPAGLITAASPVNTNYPSGVWSTQQAQPYIQNGVWGDDPYFDRTMALLHGDGTNGAQNSSFIDSSANAYAITKSGNTTQGTFSPFSVGAGEWSNYFDGTDDRLSIANNTAFDFGTGNFTIECWFYLVADATATTGGTRGANIVSVIPSSGTVNGYALYLSGNSTTTGTGIVFENTVSNTGYFATYTATISKNTWHHVAVARSGTTTKLFFNGAEVVSTTLGNQTVSNYSNATNIGASTYTGYTSNFPGYLSNVRIVKGTAVYTSAFTPSTTPLTAIANTSLLTCQSNRFIDNSTNAFAITRNGDVRVNPLTPFPSTTVYDQSVTGTSGYFDGTGDYLTIANNGLQLTTGEFTIEAWVYIFNFTNSPLICENAKWNFGRGGGYRFGSNTSGNLILSASNGVFNQYPTLITSANTVTAGQWTHVAVVRDASNFLNIYINGVSTTTPVSFSTTLNVDGGGSAVTTSRIAGAILDNTLYSTFPGYMAGLRLVNGTCLYTSNFTPPNPPFSNVTNTQFLCNFANIGMTDNTGLTSIETIGDSQVATTQLKYGNGSIRFDGTGDYLILTSAIPTAFAFGSGNFTIEFWYYSNNSGVQHIMYDSRPASTNGAYITLYKQASNLLTLWVGGAVRITGTTAIQPNTWYHVACVRFGTNTELYLNGVQEGATYGDTNVYLNPVGRPVIGADGASLGATPLNGFIDDLRVTLGVARYTANFQPPLARFPNQ